MDDEKPTKNGKKHIWFDIQSYTWLKVIKSFFLRETWWKKLPKMATWSASAWPWSAAQWSAVHSFLSWITLYWAQIRAAEKCFSKSICFGLVVSLRALWRSMICNCFCDYTSPIFLFLSISSEVATLAEAWQNEQPILPKHYHSPGSTTSDWLEANSLKPLQTHLYANIKPHP